MMSSFDYLLYKIMIMIWRIMKWYKVSVILYKFLYELILYIKNNSYYINYNKVDNDWNRKVIRINDRYLIFNNI